MSFHKIIFSITLLLFVAITTCAQNAANGVIHEIKFTGDKKSNIKYLHSVIICEHGADVEISKIEEDVQTLKNLTGIGNASYQLDTIDSNIILTFHLDEVKTLLPILKFGGIKDNIWFQAGFVDINFQGKGQTLSGYYQNNDRRHSGEVFYRIPNFRNGPWGFSASLLRWASREPLFFPEGTVQYDYDNNSAAFTAIRNFGLTRSVEFGGTYFLETYRKSDEQFLDEPPGPESLSIPKFLGKVVFYTNKLDYHFFYLNGYDWRITSQNVLNTNDQSWFQSLIFQGRRYFTFKEKNKEIHKAEVKANLAFRLTAAISTNNDSPFAPFVVDSHVNLRGVGNRIDRGTAQVIFNAEYRYTIHHREKENGQWGAQLVAFTDVGTWRNPGGKLEDIFNSSQFRQFIGGGFRVINNKVFGAVLRVDYGVDIFNPEQRGFVIGLGQYF